MKKITNAEMLDIKSQGMLWHGVSIFKVMDILNRGFFEAHTTQRFWTDGIRRKDNDPIYNDSKWMYGWSMSRDLSVSKNFGFVIFAFDRKELQTQFKVKPYCWGFSIKSGFNHKREKEEFVMSGGVIDSQNYYENRFAELEEQYDNVMDELYSSFTPESEKEELKKKMSLLEKEMDENNFMDIFTKPHGKHLPVSKAKGFYINSSEDYMMEMEDLKPKIQALIDHPMFLGFI